MKTLDKNTYGTTPDFWFDDRIELQRQYPSWCCQRCGNQIGYIGRFLEFMATPILWMAKSIFHDCPVLFTLTSEKIAKRTPLYIYD